MDEFTDLPLFPLNVVMFPHAKMELHIFEERYKKMINECIDEGKIFGINLFTNEKIFLTGCTSEISEVKRKTITGEFDIVSKGIRRYEIMNYKMTANKYFVGEVIFSKNSNFITDDIKFHEAVNNYNELTYIVYKGSIKPIDPNIEKWQTGEFSPSFLMAEKCGLSVAERQTLLEINNEDDRIFFMLNYFESIMPKLKDADRIVKIIMSDGYLVQ